jgi:hypothetical protein
MARGEAALETLGSLAERVRPVMLARDRQLPVLPALESLFPGGALRRGSVVSVGSGPAAGPSGVTSLALALVAGPSQAGSWVAAVGLGSLGLLAAADLGVALDRLALATGPPSPVLGAHPARNAPDVPQERVVAALVDGFDVVLVASGPGVRRRAADARRLVARVRERGAVLVTVGGDLPGQPANVRLAVTAARWEGLGEGEKGYFERRRVVVEASGRGEASRPRRAELWLPNDRGELAPAEPAAPAVLAPGCSDSAASPPSQLGAAAGWLGRVVVMTPTSGARTALVDEMAG